MSTLQEVQPDGSQTPSIIGRSTQSARGHAIFDGAESQNIRACFISDVMRDMCSVMAQVEIGGAWWATDESYHTLSAPVHSLDSFLSHTWATSRWTKFAQLAFVFNLNIAFAISLCVSVACAAFTYLGVVPALRFEYSPQQPSRGVPSLFVGPATYYLCVIFAGDICRCLGLRKCGPKVFLDKLCVHQTDGEQKRRGIAALAAVIKRSRSMTILHDRGYLTRLWTNFELACYVTVHGAKGLVWVPAKFPMMALSMSLVMTVTTLTHAFVSASNVTGLEDARIEMAMFVFSYFAGLGAVFVLLRHWASARKAIDSELSEFDIRRAQCADEADRETVLDLVAMFEGASDLAAGSESKERALDQFNERMRQNVRCALLRSFGRHGIHYKHVCACTWTYIISLPDRAACLYVEMQPWEDIIMRVLQFLVVTLCILPLIVALLSWLSSWRLHKRTCRRSVILYGVVCSLSVAAIGIGLAKLLELLDPLKAPGSSLIPFVAYIIVLQSAAFIVYYRDAVAEPASWRQ